MLHGGRCVEVRAFCAASSYLTFISKGRVENYRNREALPSRRNVLRSTCVQVTSVCTTICLSVSQSVGTARFRRLPAFLLLCTTEGYECLLAHSGLLLTQTELLVLRVTRSGRSRLSFNPGLPVRVV
jgi:hypothetical protein